MALTVNPIFWLALLALLMLSGCGSEEDKPHYKIESDMLRIYAGNEQLGFAVSGQHLNDQGSLLEIQGDIQLQYQTSTQTHYPANDNVINDARVEAFVTDIPNIPQETLRRHFYQDADGTLFLYAISLDEEGLFWLLPEGATESPGVQALTSPLQQSSNQADFDLWRCTNNLCTLVGSGTESINYVESETVSTPYANFDTYRFNYSLTISSSDTGFDDSEYQSVTATYWIYPRLGPVKFNRTRISQTDGRISYKAFLATTNVKL